MERNEIHIIYGTDAAAMTRALLESIDIEKQVAKDASIGLKPNLVVPKPASSGATTTPAITETIIVYLQEKGYKNLCIIESAWIGASTKRGFSVSGYDKMAKKYNVGLYDVKDDAYETHTAGGISIEMSKRVMALDFLISLPVLKGHCQTAMTCALKNMKGCISDRSKRVFHTQGLHRPIAALNRVRAADLVIVDSLNGDLDFEEGGNPVETHRMFTGHDSVLVDAFGAALMGYDLSEVPYIGYAEKLGVGRSDLETAKIVQLPGDVPGVSGTGSRKIKRLEGYADQSAACSACYANLIHALARLEDRQLLPRLKDRVYIGQGFKGKKREGCGVGACTANFSDHLPGCPPRAIDIVRFLEKKL